MELSDVGVSDEDVGGGWESCKDGLDDVWDEMEATVDGLPPEDGDLLYVGHRGLGGKTGRVVAFLPSHGQIPRTLRIADV